MAGTTSESGKSAGTVPPRPGAKGQPVPKRPTGKPGSYGPRQASARPVQRVSARQAVQQRRQRNTRLALGGVGLVLLIVVALIVADLAGAGKPGAAPGTQALPASEFNQVTAVPLTSLIANGVKDAAADKKDPNGAPSVPPYIINGSPLSLNGHPEILYLGAEFCPFCAAERWALVMALSKFGTFSGVRATTSSATDENASTPTFSFYKSKYKSKYVAFVAVEEDTNTDTPLQAPTAQQQALVSKWDVSPYTTEADSIPFIYMGGKYLLTGAQYDASKIAGWQMDQAVPYMTSGSNPTSVNAQASAALVTADICVLTHNKPANVCSALPASLKVFTTNSSKAKSKGHSTIPNKSSKTSTTKTK